VEDSNKHIIEEIVRQVGYLPEFTEISCTEFYPNRTKSVENRETFLSCLQGSMPFSACFHQKPISWTTSCGRRSIKIWL